MLIGKWHPCVHQKNSGNNNGNLEPCVIYIILQLEGKRVVQAFIAQPNKSQSLVPSRFDPVPNTCFRSFGLPSGCVGPIVLRNDLKCRYQLGESCCPFEFWPCYPRLLLPWPLSVGQRSWPSRWCFFGRMLLIGSCCGIDNPLHSWWSYSTIQYDECYIPTNNDGVGVDGRRAITRMENAIQCFFSFPLSSSLFFSLAMIRMTWPCAEICASIHFLPTFFRQYMANW